VLIKAKPILSIALGEGFVQPKFRRGAARKEKAVKEQLANMTIMELVKKSHEATGNQLADEMPVLVTELACRLEALNLAYIGAMNNLRSATSTIDQLAAENAAQTKFIDDDCWVIDPDRDSYIDAAQCVPDTPATDALQRELRAQAHKEGAYFVANRMLAAWEAGFIEDTAKNAADIARMILTSIEFMADAPEGDFDRSFADSVLEDIAAQLRDGEAS